MREDKFSKTNLILYFLGLIPACWLGLLTAPAIGGGIPNLIKNIFWDMNVVSSSKKSVTENVVTEMDDGNGNIVETTTHKTVSEMATQYGFSASQKEQLNELLSVDKQKIWTDVLSGITNNTGDIVQVALSQIGNVGGQPYWSWYGFSSRVEWCACFVSWCANGCGYIENGIIPKYASCVNGVSWFKNRGQWQDNTYTPKSGDIIFFDWRNDDGLADHTGIVQKVDSKYIYMVEGNNGDSCKECKYKVTDKKILGYGIPKF